ncbi:cysteine peptidase family C39 domain-containing protein [Maridesulfovibrio sp.]|uniref:C39 family peptidase n=1 Tax=Maridesulfovibrio sp. TaxID=2795000 RepID=UPI002A18C2B8|nr:cysteine peptidase family C39 domain-containing protein [Maridesulfovibrio sp.]
MRCFCILIPLLMFVAFPVVSIAGSPYISLQSMKKLSMKGIEKQTLDYSCGAASLALLLQNYFSDVIDEKTILADITHRLSLDELKVRIEEGFSMLDLKEAAQRLGYMADGVMLKPEHVKLLKGPIIILLHREKTNHFVVLKGSEQGRAFIADPVRGHVRVPLRSLWAEWKGETLVVGRAGFGLPTKHGLTCPKGGRVAPEMETARFMQSLRVY